MLWQCIGLTDLSAPCLDQPRLATLIQPGFQRTSCQTSNPGMPHISTLQRTYNTKKRPLDTCPAYAGHDTGTGSRNSGTARQPKQKGAHYGTFNTKPALRSPAKRASMSAGGTCQAHANGVRAPGTPFHASRAARTPHILITVSTTRPQSYCNTQYGTLHAAWLGLQRPILPRLQYSEVLLRTKCRAQATKKDLARMPTNKQRK